MSTRHILLTSVASIGLLFSVSHMSEALAEKGKFLSPSSQWAVTKVDGNPTAGQAGYCAVAKRYEGNAILTIARNQGAETSFALDLQKPMFNPAQSMKVTLDPGAGQQRDYSISPASQQAFVVRLGSDEAFFNAVDRTGILRVEVAEQSYVFNVSDIASGQSKLNSCLASAVQPAAGGRNAPVAFDTVVETSSNKEFIAELNARIRSLESQNSSLQAKIVDVERQPLTLAQKPASNAAASVRVEELRAENLRLKAELQTGELELRSEKLSLLEADNARLTQEVSRQSRVTNQVEQLQTRIDALLSENATLKQKNSSVDGAQLSSLRRDIDALEAENDSLKVALVKQSEVSDVSEQLRQRIALMESENRSLKDKQASFVSEDAGVEALKIQHAQEIASLQARIEGLRMAQNAGAKDDEAIKGLQGELASLRADNILLQQELYEKGTVEPSPIFEIENADVAALEFENKKLASELEQSQKAHVAQDQAIVALEKENFSLKSTLESIDVASVDGLNVKLDRLTQALANSQAEQVAQEEKLAALVGENATLKASLDAKVAENLSLAGVADDVQSLKTQIVEKDAKLAEFKGVPERLQSLLSDYKAAKAETEKLAVENEKMRDAENVNATLAMQLADAEALNQRLKNSLDEVQGKVLQMAALNDDVKALNLALSEKEEEISALSGLRAELDAVLAENAALKNDAVQVALVSDDAQAKVNKDIAKENIALRRSLSSVIAKVEGQNELIEEQGSKLSKVFAKNEALKGQLDLAAQLIASNDVEAAEEPLKQQAAVEVSEEPEPEARVILASAAPDMPKPRVKPSIKPSKKSGRGVVENDRSFAETLAQLEPAAGDEDVIEAVEVEVIETPEVIEAAQDFMERDLNQAQIYEEQLKRSLNNEEIIAESREEPIDVETLENDLIAADDIDAVIEAVATPEELPALDEPTVADVQDVESAVEDAQKFTAQMQEADAIAAVDDAATQPEDVEIKMSQDPFEGIAVEGESVSEVAAIQDDVRDIEALPKSVKQPKSSPVAIGDVSPDANGVERVLAMANVSGITNVSAVPEKSDAYQWRAGSLFGSGEQREMNSSAQFDEYVKDYLTKTEARCPGDFAIVPDNSKESGSMRVDSYEIACVGSNVSSSASLIFYNEGSTFTVLAHETEAAQMADAMAVRDQIFTTLAGGRDS